MTFAKIVNRSYERVRELVGGARSLGLLYTIACISERLIPASLFRVGHELLMEINLQGDLVSDRDQGELIWAGLEDPEWLSGFKPSNLLSRLKRSALQNERLMMGDRVLMFKQNGMLSAYVWFRTNSFKEVADGITYALSPKTVWLYDARVDTAYRGKGMYRRLLKAAARDLTKFGYSRIVLAVDNLNRNAVRGHLAADAIIVGRVLLVRVFGRGVCMAKTDKASGFRFAYGGPNSPIKLTI